ncbi:SIS domain-containing protein [Bacteroidetes bacterium endosymbiont of Geopemphigus sp.]|uniref:SIS domain-containing protein n=1 Tax=Bacteroidetes bacterium endosymbiont of Geopemphigus sp. TaxID=2047937 RepID=UPI0018A81B27|nr:SIS domain-containing protein [Bacteroidetes bacterium endosymbiont of Geopemphigus sp.]
MVISFHSIGLASQFLHASEALHGDIGMLNQKDIVICLSKNGSSTEIHALIPPVRKKEAYFIAITAEKQSELAKKYDSILLISEKNEADKQNLIPTISTTSQLALGDALLIALTELKKNSREDFSHAIIPEEL